MSKVLTSEDIKKFETEYLIGRKPPVQPQCSFATDRSNNKITIGDWVQSLASNKIFQVLYISRGEMYGFLQPREFDDMSHGNILYDDNGGVYIATTTRLLDMSDPTVLRLISPI